MIGKDPAPDELLDEVRRRIFALGGTHLKLSTQDESFRRAFQYGLMTAYAEVEKMQAEREHRTPDDR